MELVDVYQYPRAPAQSVFDTTALPAADWGLAILAAASSVLLLEEARKGLQRILRVGARKPVDEFAAGGKQ